MTTPNASQPAMLRTRLLNLRILVATMAWGCALFGFVLWTILHLRDDESPQTWLWALAVGIPAVVGACAWIIGRSARPVPPQASAEEATGHALGQLTSHAILAAVLCNSGAAVWVAIAMVAEGAMWPGITACLLCALFVVATAWPSRGRLLGHQTMVNREGGRARLVED